MSASAAPEDTTDSPRSPSLLRGDRLIRLPPAPTGPRPDARGTRDWARVHAADRPQYGDAEVAT